MAGTVNNRRVHFGFPTCVLEHWHLGCDAIPSSNIWNKWYTDTDPSSSLNYHWSHKWATKLILQKSEVQGHKLKYPQLSISDLFKPKSTLHKGRCDTWTSTLMHEFHTLSYHPEPANSPSYIKTYVGQGQNKYTQKTKLNTFSWDTTETT